MLCVFHRFGSEELKRQFLAPTIAGDVVACLGVSEVGSGSDVASKSAGSFKEQWVGLSRVTVVFGHR